jgi:hypothetical protein
MRRTGEVLRGRLDDALDEFFDLFEPTIELAKELVSSKARAQEVLTLLCARLDALASSAVGDTVPSRQAFVSFVTSHSQKPSPLNAVSVPDLYYELAYHRWLLPGTLERPGRLTRYTRLDDPLISLLIESGIPLIQGDADRLLSQVMKGLKKHFRVQPGQSLSKPSTAQRSAVTQRIVETFGARHADLKSALPAALTELLTSKKVATILYQKFRSGAVHSVKVVVNEDKFFAMDKPYWEPGASPYFGSYLNLEFPAKYLLALLGQCIQSYRRHILAKGKLPPDVYYHVFRDDFLTSLEFLDHNAVSEATQLKPRLPHR